MANFFTLTAGIDNFTGQAGDYNVFRFTPTTLQATDTLTGGAAGIFYDLLEMTASGTVTAAQFAGVNGMEALQLSATTHNVTLANNVTGSSSFGYFTVFANTGSDTVDGSGLSNGVAVRFYDGAGGTDNFKGGNGDDVFSFQATSLTSADTVVGGTGFDSLEISTPGTVAAAALAGVSAIEALIMHGGNTVTLTQSITTADFFSIYDYSGNNSVDATALSSNIIFYAGSGSDSMLGGTGIDTLVVAGADLDGTDVFNGGAGLDQITITTPGTITSGQLAGVSNVEQIVLNAGGTIHLANNVSSAGYLFVYGGAGTDDVLDATGVTGYSVIMNGSGGADTLLGSTRDDQFAFAAADLTSADVVTGGGSTNYDSLVITTPGTVTAGALAGVSGVDIAILFGGVDFTAPQGITSQPIFSIFNYGANNIVNTSAFTTTQTLFYAIPGSSDQLTGGAATDTYRTAAADIDSTDIFNGNGGIDQLTITTAGTIAAADLVGFTNLEIVQQLNGGTIHFANTMSSSGSLLAAGGSAVDFFDGSAMTTTGITFAGGGGADFLLGGDGDDNFFIPDSNFAQIAGAAGLDRITLGVAGQSFDLTANNSKITNIEVVSLTSSAGATLDLAGTDIPLVTSANTLYVVGGSDDQVNAGNGWTLISTTNANAAVAPGVNFIQYQHSNGSTLFVADQISLSIGASADNAPDVELGGFPPDAISPPDGPDHAANYTTGDTNGVAIADVDAVINDPDLAGSFNAKLDSLSAVITNPNSGALEFLTLTANGHTIATSNGITIMGENTASLSLTGLAEDTVYQSLLREIRYVNTDESFTGDYSARIIHVDAHDQGGMSATQRTSTITLTNGDALPVAADDTQSTGENTILNTSVPTATDADGTIASYVLDANVPAGQGSLTFNNDGSYQFNPGTDFDSLAGGATQPVQFTYHAVDNQGAPSNVATITINVQGINDAPTVTTSAGNAAYTEGSPAIQIDATVATTDVDDANLESAVVSISAGFQSGDSLNFVNQNGISGTYNNLTGVLSLSGTSSKANYQTALESITFSSTNATPVTSKTVSFKVNDGDTDSNVGTKIIDVTPVNSAPVANPDSFNVNEDNSLSVPAASGVLFNDSDADGPPPLHANLVTGPVNALSFTLNDDGSFDYTPNANFFGDDTFTYNTSDSNGTPGVSGTATVTIHVASIDDAPVLTASAGSVPYTENAAAVTIDGGLTLTDIDDTNMESAQVRISVGFQSGDSLNFINQNGITGTYNNLTGVLGLSGTSTKANYQTALESITFSSTNDNPVATKTIEFKANDGDLDSNLATRDIAVTAVNDAPVDTNSGGTTPFTEDGAAVVIDNGFTVTDVDSPNLSGATVSITGNFNVADVLAFVNTVNITGSYNSGSGVLTLSGTDTVLNYQAALRSVTFDSNDQNPGTTRTISFQTTDDQATPGNTSTKGIAISPLNDAPSVTVPTDATVPAAFSHTNLSITGLSVADVDANPGNVTATIVATNAGLSFNTAGLAGSTGNGGHTVTLTGTVAQVNTALASLVYNSDDGFTGTDTVNLSVSDLGNSGAGGTLTSGTSTFHVGVVPQVWYIDNTNVGPGNGTGTSADPFHSIDAFNASSAPGTGDYIYVRTGTGTYTGQGINLKDGQVLLGASESLSFTNPSNSQTVNVEAGGGARPTIQVSAANATDQAVDLASGNTVKGLILQTTQVGQSGLDDGSGATGGTVGSLLVNNVDVIGTGKAVDIDQGGTLNVTLGSLVSSASSTEGVDLESVGGTFTATAGVGGISGSTGDAFKIVGGTVGVTYNGAITQAGAGALVSVTGGHATGTVAFGSGTLSATNGTGLQFDNADGTYQFNGTTTLAGGNAGIDILNGSAGTFTFGTGTTVTSPTGTAFDLQNSTANVTFSGNITQANNAVAVNVVNESGGTVTFQTGTISATNGTGLQFNNADGTVNFNGTTTLNGGNAGVDITNGSAGSFTFGSNASITSPTGNAFDIQSSTASVTYSGNITQANNAATVNVLDHSGGTLTFQTGTISATNGTGLQFNNADGTYNFTGTTTLNGGDSGIDILAGSDATNGSTGTFSFGNNTTITNPTGTSFNLVGSDATVTYSGSISDNTGGAVSIDDHDANTITFQTGNITSSGGTVGISVTNSGGGTINFNNPSIQLTGTGGANGVTLGSNTGSTINFTPAAGAGLDISTSSTGLGFTATGGGTINVTGSGNSISTTSGTGTALNLNGVTIGASGFNFASVSTSGAANGILLDTVGQAAGSTGIDIGGGSIANATTRGVDINATSADISIGASISNTGGRTVEVTNTTGNKTIDFSGAIDENGLGINLQTNTGTTINFTGALTIDTTTNTGFTATAGGTVNANNAANHIATSTGTALNVANTNIGASGLVFHDITANGAPNGIVLNTTGTAGGLTITGTGTTAGSGGTITNTTGSGISINSVTGLSLSNMNITGSGDAIDENGIRATELTGTASLTNMSVTNSFHANVMVKNSTGTLTLGVTNSTFTGSETHDGMDVYADNSQLGNASTATVTTNISNSTFSNNFSDGFDGGFGSNLTTATANSNISITGGHFNNNGANGIQIAESGSGDSWFNIHDITDITGNPSLGINLFMNNQSTSSAQFRGMVNNNTINYNTVNGGGQGILLNTQGNGTATVEITNNTVNYTDGANTGITIQSGDGSPGTTQGGSGPTGHTVVKFTGNTVNMVDNLANGNQFALRAINIESGLTAASNRTINLDMGTAASATDNTHVNLDATSVSNGVESLRVRERPNSDFTILGLTPSPATTVAQVQTFLASVSGLSSSSIFVSGAPTFEINYTNGLADTTASHAPLMAAQGQGSLTGTTLTAAMLAPIVAEAIHLWANAGATADQLAQLSKVHVDIADLANTGMLANASASNVTVDVNGAGWGWFVDSTPGDNAEFSTVHNATELAATSGAAAGQMDLLTVVAHEMGHAIGLDHSTALGDVMEADLTIGTRRLPDGDDVAAAAASAAAPAMVGTTAADSFVFDHAAFAAATAATPQSAQVVGYSAAQGDVLDLTALLLHASDSSVSSATFVRAIESADGTHATLQIDTDGPANGQHWIDLATLNGAHQGDTLNVLVGQHNQLQIHVDWLV